MSQHINDTISDALLEAVDENVERAEFLQKKVYEKLQDFDLEGAIDLVSNAVRSDKIYWELQIEDMEDMENTTEGLLHTLYPKKRTKEEELEHEELVNDHIKAEILMEQKE